uniref:long-chain-fatty-acid--CoA ligase n=1 Tax=Ditylenchus dipsaci TaxID=166011 RepID=A0A915CVP3_9BILA
MRVSDQQQAVEIGEEGTGIYKSALLKDDKRNTVDTFFPEVTTLYHAFLRGMEVSENGACLGQRVPKDGPYAFMSLKPCNETHVGIYARNCPEWLISTLACVRYSMVVVPLYDTLALMQLVLSFNTPPLRLWLLKM